MPAKATTTTTTTTEITTGMVTGSVLLLASPVSESRSGLEGALVGERVGGATTQSKVLGRAGTGLKPGGQPVLQRPACRYWRPGSLPQEKHVGATGGSGVGGAEVFVVAL